MVVAAPKVPQVGEHAVVPATSVQATPEFEESFWTLAFRVTAAVPAVIVVSLLVMLTEMGCGVGAGLELELEQPVRAERLKRETNNSRE